MNTVVTSKEEILKKSRELIRKQGFDAISIRNVASVCGVSVGSIYNYFASKTELTQAVVESIWCEMFHRPGEETAFTDTQACIRWIYTCLEKGCRAYPGFFTLHSLGFMQDEKQGGKQRMQQTWQHILSGLCTVLHRDSKIRSDAFHEEFTEEQFADVIFSLMLSALMRKDYNPSAVLEIVRRSLY